MISTLLYILFCFAALVLIVVILLQEGKGGGFGQALGEHGQQTFGVGSKGINTFTGVTAAVFLAIAIVLHIMNRSSYDTVVQETITTPEGWPQTPVGNPLQEEGE